MTDSLYVIFIERGDAEAKGVRDQLLEPNLLLLLVLAKVLDPINVLSKYLETITLVNTSITVKVNHLIEKFHIIIKDSLSDPQVADSKLKFFNKAVPFPCISGQS